MPILTSEEVSSWTKSQVEKELRERRSDVASIRQKNGDSLIGVKGTDADRVSEHMQSLNALGERFDAILADEQEGEDNERRFTRLSEYLNDPDPEQGVPLPTNGSKNGRKQDGPGDIGGMFVESEAWKAYNDTGALNKPTTVPVEALFGPASRGIGEVPGGRMSTLFDSSGFPSRPDYRDGQLVDTLYQANNIGQLMPQGSTDSDTIKYPVETVTATGAAEVAEGSTKPEAQISFADTTEPVQLIAVLLPMTNKSLKNAAFLRAYINARLRLFVQMREDSQLLNGNGTTPNIRGILNRSGINTATSYSIGGSNPDQALIDAVFHAAMRVQDSFLLPDAAVMKPATWEIAALAKDGNRNYILGGPGSVNFVGSDPSPRLWGLRVVLNANMPAQSATNKPVLVGAFAASAMIVRRGGIELALSESHSTFFAENKVMLRAEEELALCVFRPAGFATVTSAT